MKSASVGNLRSDLFAVGARLRENGALFSPIAIPALENPMSSPRTKLANAIRVLSMDAVQKANSGHPGMPMGMADVATVLWTKFLKHNPIG